MRRDSQQFYYAYMLASRSRTLYIGVTGNLTRRIWEHKNGRGGSFTSRYKINRLVWSEAHADAAAAIAREKQLKGLIRAKKIALIELDNPTWQDLSEGWNEPLETKNELTADASLRSA